MGGSSIGNGGERLKREGYIYVHVCVYVCVCVCVYTLAADSLCCTAETDITL